MNRQLHPASIAMMIGALALGTLVLAGCSGPDKPPPTATPKAMAGKSPDDQIKSHMQQIQQGQGTGGQ